MSKSNAQVDRKPKAKMSKAGKTKAKRTNKINNNPPDGKKTNKKRQRQEIGQEQSDPPIVKEDAAPQEEHDDNGNDEQNDKEKQDKKKQPQRQTFVPTWTKVEVELAAPEVKGNHYDNDDENDLEDNKNIAANRDLEAQPGEHMAMFFGLEVIPGNAYRVIQDSETGAKQVVFDTTTTTTTCNDNSKKTNNDTKKTSSDAKTKQSNNKTTDTTTAKDKKDNKKDKKSKQQQPNQPKEQDPKSNQEQEKQNSPQQEKQNSQQQELKQPPQKKKESRREKKARLREEKQKKLERQERIQKLQSGTKSKPGNDKDDEAAAQEATNQNDNTKQKQKQKDNNDKENNSPSHTTKTEKGTETTAVDKDNNNDDEASSSEAEQKVTNQQTSEQEKESVDIEVDNDDNHESEQQEEQQLVSQSSQSNNSIIDNDTLSSMQSSWLASTGGVVLSHGICRSLIQQQFWTPTPIQAAVLPAAILGRCNIVGAAPTGSGKTLAYLLPICEFLLEQQQLQTHRHFRTVQALILAPTRELALQIHKECDKLLDPFNTSDKMNSKVKSSNPYKKWIGTIVGGLAHAKQARVLRKQRPPIVVGTPGRLWELIATRDYDHLNDLSRIRFLVIDEADRMVTQGSFPQLTSILNEVHRANPMYDENDPDSDDEEEDAGMDSDDDDDPHRLMGLPGIPGEAKLEMLTDDILEQIQKQQQEETKKRGRGVTEKEEEEDDDDSQEGSEEEEDEDEDDSQEGSEEEEDEEEESDQDSSEEREMGDDDGKNDAEDKDSVQEGEGRPTHPPVAVVQRQTFVYSATLTLPASPTYKRSPAFMARIKGVDGAIAEILEKSHAKGKTKIVDLANFRKSKKQQQQSDASTTTPTDKKNKKTKDANNSEDATSSNEQQFNLPPGLKLQEIQCTQKHKDSHLFAYLVTTDEGASGPCLVFCNSIAAVRRVGATLQYLGLNVRILHANMQQRARFKAIESLRTSNDRTVVVATDVAARGLDIPSVASVVHYDVARAVDTFVHRSGRTARGMGHGAVGASLSLISPAEDKAHTQIRRALKHVPFETVLMDGRLVREAEQRVHLASKIVTAEDVEGRSKRNRSWMKEQANKIGFDVDENLLDRGLSGGDEKDKKRFLEAMRAKGELKMLLAQPMRTQRHGKYLPSYNAGKQKELDPLLVSDKLKEPSRKKRKKRR